jgi:hypothetical protein
MSDTKYTKKRKRLEAFAFYVDARVTTLERLNDRFVRAVTELVGRFGAPRWGAFPQVRRRRWAKLNLLRAWHVLRAVLTSRYWPLIVLALGIAFAAPTLWAGWGVEDDVMHRAKLLSASLPEALTGLYVFLDPNGSTQLVGLDTVPWWALDAVRVSFFRPLAALTLWLDYQLWPNSAVLMHAHSALWYGGACALATLLYRRVMGRTLVGGLAAFLFAVCATHLNCVVSLAARNAVLALFFGLLTLVFHDRWRRGGWRAGGAFALLGLALALLSAEAGLATTAYLGAYALCLERGRWYRRLGSLVPYGIVVVAWRAAYQVMGYGAWGSGFYLDPLRDPLRFAAAVLERGPVLLMSLWSLPDPGIYAILSVWAGRVFWLAAVLFMAFVGAMLFPLLRKNRAARFWGLGMLLAVIPACAISMPTGRLLVFVSVGAMGLMAQFIGGLLERSAWLPAHGAWRVPATALTVFLVGLHAVVFPALLPCVQTFMEPFVSTVTDLGPLPGVEDQQVVIVNVPSPGQLIYVPSLREVREQPAPARIRMLSPGSFAVDVTRVDAYTLVIRPERGYLAPTGMGAAENQTVLPLLHSAYGYQRGDDFFRGDGFSLALGQSVDLDGMRAEVISLTGDGRPAEARIRFAVPLDDPSLVWLQWDWGTQTYVPFSPPSVGETAHISGPFEVNSPVWRAAEAGVGAPDGR